MTVKFKKMTIDGIETIAEIRSGNTKTTVYIVQEEQGGISDDPVVFRKEQKAEQEYLRLLNKHEGKKFKKIDAAVNYLRNTEDYMIRLFVCEVE